MQDTLEHAIDERREATAMMKGVYNEFSSRTDPDGRKELIDKNGFHLHNSSGIRFFASLFIYSQTVGHRDISFICRNILPIGNCRFTATFFRNIHIHGCQNAFSGRKVIAIKHRQIIIEN